MAKEIVAMILAGGRGSRLYALTQKTAKPAVSFGGKYRIELTQLFFQTHSLISIFYPFNFIII